MVQRQLKLPLNKSLFLFGPRQVGKSTLLRTLFCQQHSYFYNLLDTDLYLRLVARPALLTEEVNRLDPCISHIVIDEIQRVPDLLNEVHRIIESEKPRKFILSGSSVRKLKREGANMLGGRGLTYELFPFTHIELAENFNLSRALELGTLPAVYLEEDRALAAEILYSYVKTYIEEEIKQEAQVRNLGAFLRFLGLAASENGRIISYSNIAADIHVDYKTVREYYQILEDTLLGFNLIGYASSTRKQLSKSPKFYFFDTGVQRAIYKKLELELIPATSEFGDTFEHFIIAEIMRLCSYARKCYDFSYYRTKDGAEVDLIVEKPDGSCLAIEIKASANVRVNKLSGLRSFKELRPEAKLICASLVERAIGNDEITVLPWREAIKEVLA